MADYNQPTTSRINDRTLHASDNGSDLPNSEEVMVLKFRKESNGYEKSQVGVEKSERGTSPKGLR